MNDQQASASEQPKRILSHRDVEYTYETDIVEIQAGSQLRPIAIIVTITELREQVSEYTYPGLDRSTSEEDEQRRVVFEKRINLDDPAAYDRMKAASRNPDRAERIERMFPPRGANLVDAPVYNDDKDEQQ